MANHTVQRLAWVAAYVRRPSAVGSADRVCWLQNRAQHRDLLPRTQDDEEHPAGHAVFCVPPIREVADVGPGDPAGVTKMEVAHQDTSIIGAQEQALASADGYSALGVVYGHGRL